MYVKEAGKAEASRYSTVVLWGMLDWRCGVLARGTADDPLRCNHRRARAAACRRQTNNQNKRHNAGDEMKEQRAHCNENDKKDPREEEVQRKHYEQE